MDSDKLRQALLLHPIAKKKNGEKALVRFQDAVDNETIVYFDEDFVLSDPTATRKTASRCQGGKRKSKEFKTNPKSPVGVNDYQNDRLPPLTTQYQNDGSIQIFSERLKWKQSSRVDHKADTTLIGQLQSREPVRIFQERLHWRDQARTDHQNDELQAMRDEVRRRKFERQQSRLYNHNVNQPVGKSLKPKVNSLANITHKPQGGKFNVRSDSQLWRTLPRVHAHDPQKPQSPLDTLPPVRLPQRQLTLTKFPRISSESLQRHSYNSGPVAAATYVPQELAIYMDSAALKSHERVQVILSEEPSSAPGVVIVQSRIKQPEAAAKVNTVQGSAIMRRLKREGRLIFHERLKWEASPRIQARLNMHEVLSRPRNNVIKTK